MAINTCYAGPVEQGERILRPLREHGTPLLDLISPTPYVAHQSGLDSTVLHGWHYYWKSIDLPELSDDLVAVLVDHAFSAESPRSYAVIFHLGGAVSRVPGDATAYTGRNASHNININGVWRPNEEFAESEIAWTRRFFDTLKPYREGVYVNFLDVDDGTRRVREAYGEQTYQRLAEIKAEYDPDNVFHLNQNIEPTG
nr:BBE domain-containing protein [Halocatena marina]